MPADKVGESSSDQLQPEKPWAGGGEEPPWLCQDRKPPRQDLAGPLVPVPLRAQEGGLQLPGSLHSAWPKSQRQGAWDVTPVARGQVTGLGVRNKRCSVGEDRWAGAAAQGAGRDDGGVQVQTHSDQSPKLGEKQPRGWVSLWLHGHQTSRGLLQPRSSTPGGC